MVVYWFGMTLLGFYIFLWALNRETWIGMIVGILIGGTIIVYGYQQMESIDNSPNSTNSINSRSSRQRIGAICNDGWRSHSTGSGTCSHHGGVDYWLYSD